MLSILEASLDHQDYQTGHLPNKYEEGIRQPRSSSLSYTDESRRNLSIRRTDV